MAEGRQGGYRLGVEEGVVVKEESGQTREMKHVWNGANKTVVRKCEGGEGWGGRGDRPGEVVM